MAAPRYVIPPFRLIPPGSSEPPFSGVVGPPAPWRWVPVPRPPALALPALGPGTATMTVHTTTVPLIYEQRWPRVPPTLPPQHTPVVGVPLVPAWGSVPDPGRWRTRALPSALPLPPLGPGTATLTVSVQGVPLLYEQRWPRVLPLAYPADTPAVVGVPLTAGLLPPEPWRWLAPFLARDLGAIRETLFPVVVASQVAPFPPPEHWRWFTPPVPPAVFAMGENPGPPVPLVSPLDAPRLWRWQVIPLPPAIHPDLAQLIVRVDTDVPGIGPPPPWLWTRRDPAPPLVFPRSEPAGPFHLLPGIPAIDAWRWFIIPRPPALVSRTDGITPPATPVVPTGLLPPEPWRWVAVTAAGVHRYLVWDPSFGTPVVVTVLADGLLSIDLPELGVTGVVVLGGRGGMN